MPDFGQYSSREGASDIIKKFEAFLDEQPMIRLIDMDNIEMVIYVRLRSLLTPDQLHQRAHGIIVAAEQMLNTPGALSDPETGEPVKPTLVENFQGGAEDVIAMTNQTSVSDDDIAAFLTQFGTKGEEEE